MIVPLGDLRQTRRGRVSVFSRGLPYSDGQRSLKCLGWPGRAGWLEPWRGPCISRDTGRGVGRMAFRGDLLTEGTVRVAKIEREDCGVRMGCLLVPSEGASCPAAISDGTGMCSREWATLWCMTHTLS